MRSRLTLLGSVCLVAVSQLAGAAVAKATVGGEANGASGTPAISDDGRFVAFVSDATNLLGGDPSNDTNGFADAFLVDTQTGAIGIVSYDYGANAQANGDSSNVAISGNGRYVVFQTSATNLVPSDDNGSADILLYDSVDDSMTLISRRGVSGVQANGDSFAPSISKLGELVAFESAATNLVPSDSNAKSDIFLKDTTTGSVTRVSTNSSALQSNNASFGGLVSPNGAVVAFSSLASNLVANDTNGSRDGFIKNLSTGVTKRVTVKGSNTQANGSSSITDLSGNGRYVVFHSYASNLVKGDTNNLGDSFMRDRTAGTTIRISKVGTTQGNADSFGASINSDGTLIAFQTWATNLVPGPDENGADSDVLEYTVATKALTRLSVDHSGGWPDGASYASAIAGDGGSVAFASIATDLVVDDLNVLEDVFVHTWVDDLKTVGSIARWSVPL